MRSIPKRIQKELIIAEQETRRNYLKETGYDHVIVQCKITGEQKEFYCGEISIGVNKPGYEYPSIGKFRIMKKNAQLIWSAAWQ